jgi:hypothetical protein
MDRDEYRKYEVDATECSIEMGDRVTPETVIGLHHHTRQPVLAVLDGHVASVYFNPMHQSLMVMAVSHGQN